MGIEPATCCLRNSCSTTELHRLTKDEGRRHRSRYFSICLCLDKPFSIGLIEPVGSIIVEKFHICTVHNLHSG